MPNPEIKRLRQKPDLENSSGIRHDCGQKICKTRSEVPRERKWQNVRSAFPNFHFKNRDRNQSQIKKEWEGVCEMIKNCACGGGVGHITMDSFLALHPAAPGSILGIPEDLFLMEIYF